ncbi:hypothetical protein [Cryobacterium fucosi]|uniref:Uncharacterized protein n=1 Tax=Cryobacterium fucosi TaxID=1259157 RepID=A0A4R9B331_9MICO|nr:hypothetical protein [Cryobacterium fucosi]TFD74709.1 hypothetical protein E3T48_12345 [Cryobacterium fucosi]
MSEPIKREDIRKGDVIRQTFQYTAEVDGQHQPGLSKFELIERPVTLPTAMGTVIRTNNKSLDNPVGWVFEKGSRKWYGTDGEIYTPESLVELLEGKGYQVLRPVAEVAAEVLAEVRQKITYSATPQCKIHIADVTAKWAAK